MRVGGSLGTAVLGAVMASRVSGTLPEKWSEAQLPPLRGEEAEQLRAAAEVGIAPPAPEGLWKTWPLVLVKRPVCPWQTGRSASSLVIRTDTGE